MLGLVKTNQAGLEMARMVWKWQGQFSNLFQTNLFPNRFLSIFNVGSFEIAF